MKVGIPRALYYYDFESIWEHFFNGINVEIVKSPETNVNIMEKGLFNTVDEACLPVKIFHGHVEYLKDKVDYLYLPRIISISSKEYTCPKFLGLTDMVIASIKNLPPIIDCELNFYNNKKDFHNHFTNVCKILGKPYPPIGKVDYLKMYWEKYGKTIKRGKKILFLGHNYNIKDRLLNQNLIEFVESMNLSTITSDDLDINRVFIEADKLPKKLFWTFGRKLLGSALLALKDPDIIGIIFLCSFGCGPDSMIADLAERYCKREGKPFLLLTFDEHTSDVGLQTRVEAFIDMLKWRYNFESNIC